MLNKLMELILANDMIQKGDHIICAVSGGADSMALLWSMYLLKEKLGIQVSAAHFNHHLRGTESDRDESFVKNFCGFHDIPLYVGGEEIIPGEKGLEAAAREARYQFLCSLPGKIATAHTADDNAETVFMHLIRGTGLKGLGGISPKRGNIIRPMLLVTRQEVEHFLKDNYISNIEDSSNRSDDFLRNRIRHNLIPILREENPKISENITQMALRLRLDEAYLTNKTSLYFTNDVAKIREMEPSIRYRVLQSILVEYGVHEPDTHHVELLEKVLFSGRPSAKANFPNGITIGKVNNHLEKIDISIEDWEIPLQPGSYVDFSQWNLRISCDVGTNPQKKYSAFTVKTQGPVCLRNRRPGDVIHLSGGSKSLKKLMIDRKIPAALRNQLPVVADDLGLIGVGTIGFDLNRYCDEMPAIEICFENIPVS